VFRGSSSLKAHSLDGGFSGNVVLAVESLDVEGRKECPARGQDRSARCFPGSASMVSNENTVPGHGRARTDLDHVRALLAAFHVQAFHRQHDIPLKPPSRLCALSDDEPRNNQATSSLSRWSKGCVAIDLDCFRDRISCAPGLLLVGLWRQETGRIPYRME